MSRRIDIKSAKSINQKNKIKKEEEKRMTKSSRSRDVPHAVSYFIIL